MLRSTGATLLAALFVGVCVAELSAPSRPAAPAHTRAFIDPRYCRLAAPVVTYFPHPSPTPIRGIVYNANPVLKTHDPFPTIDLYPPAHPLHAVVMVVVPGGGIEAFDPAAPLDAAAFSKDSGYDAAVVNYSLYQPGRKTPTPPVTTAAEDVGCAIAWIEKYIGTHGFGGDPHRLYVEGYSAGAGLSAEIALDPAYVEGTGGRGTLSDVAGVLPLSGRYDYRAVPYTTPTPDPVAWHAIHDGAPSPLDQVAKTTFPWLVGYEQCDADQQYADFTRFVRRLRADGNLVVTYENVPGFHGYGNGVSLTRPHSDYYRKVVAFIDGTATSTGYVERVPQRANDSVEGSGYHDFAAQDVAAGPDGSVYVAENALDPSRGPDGIIAKYAGVSNTAAQCFYEASFSDAPVTGIRVAVDGFGNPWSVASDGSIRYLPGGIVATWQYGDVWTVVKSPVGALDIAAGGAYGASTVWVAGSDGNVYRTDVPAGVSRTPAPFALVPGPTRVPRARRIGEGDFGDVYVTEGTRHQWFARERGGAWMGPLPGSALDVDAGPMLDGSPSVWILDAFGYPALEQSGKLQRPAGVPAGTNIAVDQLGLPWYTGARGDELYQLHRP
jgi:acetyl esterase/lipase